MAQSPVPHGSPVSPCCRALFVAAISTSALASCRAQSPADPQRAEGTSPAARTPDTAASVSPTMEVDPFIGTGAHGHTFPGATMPFGMVQLSPDTRLTGWDGCSGYHYDDSIVYGFSHTHLSGTGIADYADVLLMPVGSQSGPIGDPGYPFAARFDHAHEVAAPGFYSVELPEAGVSAELTVTPRVGIHRYSFANEGEGTVLLDLHHRDEVLESWVEMRSPTQLVGFRRSRSWARDQRVYFAIELSRPLEGVTEVSERDLRKEPGPPYPSWSGTDVRLMLSPERGEDPLLLKVAISAVDAQGALDNLKAEAPHWDFDRYRTEANLAWEQALSTIEIEGGTPEQRRIFYTGLYHSLLAPNLYQDVDGRFRGTDGHVHDDPGFAVYTVFSLWDTFRATHPLLTIVEPERTSDFVRTLLAHFEHGGSLPMWELSANYTGTMIGYHAVPVIVDAWVKGIRGFDGNKALKASVAAAEADHLGISEYRAHGYVPAEYEHESVSKTLEYAYDDWCIATLADDLGDEAQRDRFFARAQSWENIFDPSSGLFRARDNGAWVPDFEPREVNIHYTEANAWQYGFFVPHDVGGLIARHGGPAGLERTLDQLFVEPTDLVGRQQVDITGLIGQYAHGNEPSHHTAYLYPYLGQAPKTQARVRQIVDTLYTDAPDGISGNDDCGQMSSWYVLSTLGFYPLAPGRPEYVIGSPLFPRATIRTPGGGDFVIEARGVSADAKYVQSATLNGETHDVAVLRHADIVAGGHLVLSMGTAPNPAWGAIEPEPPLADGPHGVLPTPLVVAPQGFSGSATVELSLPRTDAEIRYRLDGSPPDATSPRYSGPIEIDKTTTVTAAAFNGEQRGPWVTATVRRRPEGVTVSLLHEPHRSYRAGGPDGLIDGRRGNKRWRTGGWQGYQGADFVATVDLGRSRPIKDVTVGFLQDARSWIWMPTRLDVEVSSDGTQWKSLGTATHRVPERDTEETYVRNLVVKGRRTRARYVRVRAPSFGEIPSWHLGAGHPSFIFVDEVIVR